MRDVRIEGIYRGDKCTVIGIDDDRKSAIIEVLCGSTVYMSGKIPVVRRLVKLDNVVFMKGGGR